MGTRRRGQGERRERTASGIVWVAQRFRHDNGMIDLVSRNSQLMEHKVEDVLLQEDNHHHQLSVSRPIPAQPRDPTHHLIKVANDVTLERRFNVRSRKHVDVGFTPREHYKFVAFPVPELGAHIVDYEPGSVFG